MTAVVAIGGIGDVVVWSKVGKKEGIKLKLCQNFKRKVMNLMNVKTSVTQIS